MIHPQAQVHPSAELDVGVEVGPFAIIGPRVFIGAGTKIGPHTVIEEGTIIGCKNEIGPFVFLGGAPQHLAYRGEPTRLEIGDENVIREYVSISRGTTLDEGVTRIGHRCYLMAYVHVGHDCHLEDEVIVTSGTLLGGHVRVGFGAILGGLSAVHQFCRIGELAFVSGTSGVSKDVPPFTRVFGSPAGLSGLNLVGLRRRGLKRDVLAALSQALKLYLRAATLEEAISLIEKEVPRYPEVERFLAFLRQPSRRGVIRRRYKETV